MSQPPNVWLVIGGGVSGLGAAKLLRRRGESVRVSERSVLPPDMAAAFHALGVELCDGGHVPAHLDGVVHVVLSPGLPSTHPLVTAARQRRLTVTSEIDLALEAYRGKVLAVTGTNGKSTTCAMLGQVLSRSGCVTSVGGNYGDPPTAMLADGRAGDYLVLELSSYQLEQSELVAPAAAVFTSFSHDHLARHGSLAGYLEAKWRVFRRMLPGSLAVIPDYIYQEGATAGLAVPPGVSLWRVFADAKRLAEARVPGFAVVGDGLVLHDGSHISLASVGIREPQNRLNAGFALVCASHLLALPMADLTSTLVGFRGLPHRCELVGHINGHPVVNDSKSTNVESTLVALASQPSPVVLLMGGQGKGEPYQPILAEAAKIAALVTFGASGPDIARDLRKDLPTYEFPTLSAALGGISGILKKHPCGLLLSPGCASFDEFKNYEERGDIFRRAVAGLLGNGTS